LTHIVAPKRGESSIFGEKSVSFCVQLFRAGLWFMATFGESARLPDGKERRKEKRLFSGDGERHQQYLQKEYLSHHFQLRNLMLRLTWPNSFV
jgi:hypothetical protein